MIEHHQTLAEDAVVSVTKAEYIPPYTIHLRFSDGTEQFLNFCSFLEQSHHPEIRKYLDTELFKGFSIMEGRLDWNDYDLCFSMQDLYEGKI
jgi:hypothetical protein